MLYWKDIIIKTYEHLRTKIFRIQYIRLNDTLPLVAGHCDRCDILVFAAHPDDETIGIGILLSRLVKEGKRVKVVFTTNGSVSWKTSNRDSIKITRERLSEANQALSKIKIRSQDILSLGYPDWGLYRYLTPFAKDVERLIERMHPQKVFVHSIEGGHRDHDMTGMVVQRVCRKIGFTRVYEWAEYNQQYELGSTSLEFAYELSSDNFEDASIYITREEIVLKKEMMACYSSQMLSLQFPSQELIRKACLDRAYEHFAWAINQVPDKRLHMAVKVFQAKFENMNRLKINRWNACCRNSFKQIFIKKIDCFVTKKGMSPYVFDLTCCDMPFAWIFLIF